MEDGKMLIRWATEQDLSSWYALATEVSKIFKHPADMGEELKSKASGKGSVNRYEMLTAVDYISGNNMGFIIFSREKIVLRGLRCQSNIGEEGLANVC